MFRNWKNKNVDLTLLVTQIGNFFSKKDFEAIQGTIKNGYQILAHDSPYFDLQGYVNVTIEGSPNNFFVKLELCEKGKKLARLSPFLLSMFGAGYLFLKEMKSKEEWEKLKNEFWKHVDNSVLKLTNTQLYPKKESHLNS